MPLLFTTCITAENFSKELQDNSDLYMVNILMSKMVMYDLDKVIDFWEYNSNVMKLKYFIFKKYSIIYYRYFQLNLGNIKFRNEIKFRIYNITIQM